MNGNINSILTEMQKPIDDGRRVPEGEKQYNVTQLWDAHLEIIRLIALGYNNIEVGDMLSISPQTVSNVRNLPEAKRKLEMMHGARDASVGAMRREIRKIMPKALGVLTDVMDNELAKDSDKVRAAICVVGNSIPKISENRSISAVLTESDIDKMQKRFDAERNGLDADKEVNV